MLCRAQNLPGPEFADLFLNGVPYGIRTRVTNVKGWGPGPLDERDSAALRSEGVPPGQVVDSMECVVPLVHSRVYAGAF